MKNIAFVKQIQKKGFTLAEVLVTLAIIGVVAALTIPTLIKNTEKQQWITGYKKTFSLVSQATKMIMADNGGGLLGVWGANDDQGFYQQYVKYLKVAKKCDTMDTKGSCFGSSYTSFNGNPTSISDPYSLMLSNGSSLAFDVDAAGKGYIGIDTNGKKGPNVFGKDYHILTISLTSDPVRTQGMGMPENLILRWCPSDLSGDDGYSCGDRILRGDYAEDY